MNYDHYESLLIKRDGVILTISLNRPDARNAINAAVHKELTQIFLDVDKDPDVDIVVLTGEGESFCAGGDLKWLLSVHGKAAEVSELIRADRRLQNALLDLEKPLIARVVGPAIGLGASLALFSDFIYATPDARFADPHVSVGLVAGDGGALLWPQLIGYARAKRYLMTGDAISGVEAAEIGLITQAVPREKLDATVDEMARRLAKGPKHAIRWTKASVNAGLKQLANVIMDRAAAYECVTQMTDDHKIALEAFLDRKDPVFTGR